MYKYKLIIIASLFFCSALLSASEFSQKPDGGYYNIKFSEAQLEFISDNKGKTFKFEHLQYNNPLFFYYDGERFGFIEDILKIFEDETGMKIDIAATPESASIKNKLLNGTIIGSFTEHLGDDLTYTKNNLLFDCNIYALKDNTLNSRPPDNIKLGYVNTNENIINSLNLALPDAVLSPYDNLVSLTEALNNKSIDAVVITDFYSDEFSGDLNFTEIYLPSQYYFDFYFAGDPMFVSILDTILFSIDYKQIYKNNYSLYNCYQLGVPLDVAANTEITGNIRLGVYDNPTFHFKVGSEMCGLMRHITDSQKNSLGLVHVPVFNNFEKLCGEFLNGNIDVLPVTSFQYSNGVINNLAPESLERYKHYRLYVSDIVLYGLYEKPLIRPNYKNGGDIKLKIGFTNQLLFLNEHGAMEDTENYEFIYYNTSESLIEAVLNRELDYAAFNLYNHNPEYYDGMSLKGILGQYTVSIYVNNNEDLETLYGLLYGKSSPYSFEAMKNIYGNILNYGITLFESYNNQTRFNTILKNSFAAPGFISSMTVIIALALLSLFLSSKFKKETRRIKDLETVDYLTRLLNRNTFYQMLDNSINSREEFHYIIFEADRFKELNEQYGHDIGDLVIAHIADNIKDTFGKGKNAFIGRLGGDAFGVILKNPDKNAAINLVQQTVINAYSFTHKNISVKITLSLGIYKFNSSMSKQSLLAGAHRALKESKDKGRNTFTYYENT